MKARKRIFTPILLGLMVSACSTSSNTSSSSDAGTTSALEKTEIADVIESSEKEQTYISVLDTKKLSNDNARLLDNIASKNTMIHSLNQQLATNDIKISSLNQSLDEKDALISALQTSVSDARDLAELEKQKQSREDLESQNAALNLDNELLTRRINQLVNENTSLKEQIVSLQNTPTSQDGLQESYYALLTKNTKLQEKYANLEVDNTANYQQLIALKKESLVLAEQLSDARAEIADQKGINDAFKIREQENALKLKRALVESESSEARWKDLDNQLAQAQQQNETLASQLNAVRVELIASENKLGELFLALDNAQKNLDLQENDGISIGAAMDALRSQMLVTLQNVEWLLPSESALYDTFEILVSADVQPSFAGQSFSAELVTDSDTKMISDSIVNAVVQNGRLQWRWRVSGLNENTNAQLNLFVSQQINIEGQNIMRQVYRDGQNVSLINTNLFEKYGYWGIAILLGLLGGFFIGRLNKSKNTL